MKRNIYLIYDIIRKCVLQFYFHALPPGFPHFLTERILMGVTGTRLSGVDAGILYLPCEKEHSQKVFGVHSIVGREDILIAAVIFFFMQ